MLEVKNLIIENFTIFRFLLFLCSCSYAVILYYWLKPNAFQFRAGIMAITVQFWIGILFNYKFTELGFWKYHQMGFMTLNVPIDLHINWAILWGLGICWLSERWPGKNITVIKFLVYIFSWTVFTLLFDIMMARWMVFLDDYSHNWWIADIFNLLIIQGFTVWFYKSINKAAHQSYDLPFLPIISPYIRSLIYLSLFICLFFIYIPEQINILINYFDITMTTYHFNDFAYIILFISVAIGGWATYEFARKGEGTPIPLDEPQFLVTSGPYLFISNPMQVSGILLTISILLFDFNWINLIYLVDVILVVWLIFERFESIHLHQTYKDDFQKYLEIIPHRKINFIPQKLDKKLRPTLFIDSGCKICVKLSKQFKNFDFSDNIKIKSLTDISKNGHPHLEPVAKSKTTMVFVEPRISKNSHQSTDFLYSIKGRAALRLFGYMPAPFCFIAAFEGIPGIPLLTDLFYISFAKIRKYL